MYLRIVLRSQPVNSLIAWILIPCRCSSFSSCTSRPLNKFRNLLRMEWSPVYHVKGWGKFNRHYGDFCIGADTWQRDWLDEYRCTPMCSDPVDGFVLERYFFPSPVRASLK